MNEIMVDRRGFAFVLFLPLMSCLGKIKRWQPFVGFLGSWFGEFSNSLPSPRTSAFKAPGRSLRWLLLTGTLFCSSWSVLEGESVGVHCDRWHPLPIIREDGICVTFCEILPPNTPFHN